MQFLDHDAKVLLLCEDLQKLLKDFKNDAPWADEGDVPLQKRLDLLEKMIASEQRLIEDIGLPGRYIVEHFTMMLNEMSYSMGFKYRMGHYSCENWQCGNFMA